MPHPAPRTPDEGVGQVIGRYRLLQKLGEGGCGVVYVAEQTEPVRRSVALKIIKLGMDTKAVVARFELERQALALMNHPNIAKVLDAGATDTGRPYFVMELASGHRITEYCDRHHLSVRQRLALFLPVCHAVQHAHQKGIIHRDLKPSNILVVEHEGGALPKVIDFGIAIATGQGLELGSGLTSLNQFLGTPPYMSPEQVGFGERDIDTRSDVYSLGVILYELLAGQPPFDPQDLVHAGLDEMCRIIREQDPVRPSECLARGLSRRRLPSTAGPAREKIAAVRGDLDWIVMKCLEKDRARRYETANGLAFDIQRCLKHQPVIARPPTPLYRIQKAIQRHRIVFTSGLAVGLALVAGISASLWQATHARASELHARRTAYNSDVNLARHALGVNNLGRAQALLERHRPKPGQPDLRGWEWRYLWGQTRPDTHQTLWQATNTLGELSLSSDGRWLAMEVENEIRLWNPSTARWEPWRQPGRLPKFAPNNSRLATVRSSHTTQDTIVIFDLTQPSGAPQTFPQSGQVLALAFVDNGKALLVLTAQPTTQAIYSPTYQARRFVTAVDLRDGRVLWRQPVEPVEESTPAALGATPNASSFAVSLGAGRLRIHDVASGQEQHTVQATSEFVTALAFSPDGTTLASGAGYTDATIRLWDVRTGKLRGKLEGHRSWVTNMDFTRDGRHLISGSADQTLRRWDLSTLSATAVFRGHAYALNGVVISPDGRTLVSNTRIGEAFLWPLDKPPGRPSVRRLPGALTSAVFTPDSRAIIGAEDQGDVCRWNTDDLSEERRWNQPPGRTGIHFLRLDPQGHRAVIFGRDGQTVLWQLEEGTQTTILAPGTGPVVDCLFTRDGQYLVALLQRPSGMIARIFDLRRGGSPGTLSLDAARVVTAPALPASLLVSAPNALQLFNVAHPEAPPRVMTDPGDFAGFDATPDGQIGAAAFVESYVRVWNLHTLEPLHTLKGLLLGAHSLAISPDGNRIAVGSNGQEAVMMWDTATGQEVLTLSGEGSLFDRLAFSPDGRHILAINAAGSAHLWSAPGWEEIEKAR